MYICSTQVFFFFYIKTKFETIISYAKQSSGTFDSVSKILKILSA